MKILAVDDDPFILELMPLLAAKSGFPDLRVCASPVEALDLLAQGDDTFDCLLLDINMPVMDGIELCSRLRALHGYRNTPIIMLTAMSERDYMDRAFQAGATDYITKPFDIRELGARLRVARELVTAWRAARLMRVNHSNTLGHRHGFPLSDAIEIDGAAGLVDFVALQNYLSQISRAGLAASQIIAVKVDRIAVIYDRSNSREFVYALAEVAGALRDVLRIWGGLVSYVGAGVFLIVSNTATPLIPCDVESTVQQILDDRNAEFDSGAPMDIEVSIGNPVQPGFHDGAGVSNAVERAIARAESRYMTKHDHPPKANICNGTTRPG